MDSTVSVSRRDGVAVVELNRPDAMNAVDVTMRRELLEALDQLGRDQSIGALVLAGSGNAFCAGADLKSSATNPDTSLRRTARTLLHDFQPIIEIITRLDKPVIAAVNGAAVGVGMSLVLACDLVVMAQGAYLMAPFINIGLIPDAGAAWFLVRRIGFSRAFEYLAQSEKIMADSCLELGIANRITDPATLREDALKWATSLAARAPLALTLTKRIARLALSVGLSELMTMEAELQTFLASTDDAREGITAFGERRPPSFHGR